MINIEEDEYGKWEVEEGDGCVSKRNIEPTQKYTDEHPEEFQPKPKTEIETIREENTQLKTRINSVEQVAAETSLTQQQLLELLIDMEVI